jgi:hypothetical protein
MGYLDERLDDSLCEELERHIQGSLESSLKSALQQTRMLNEDTVFCSRASACSMAFILPPLQKGQSVLFQNALANSNTSARSSL